LAAITGKRKKTEADYVEAARREWYGSLYIHDGRPCIPGEMLEAGLVQAAKKTKRGNEAKAGIICDGFFPLEYDGPKEPDALWADGRFMFKVGARVSGKRIMRTRPRFDEWSATVEVEFMPDLLNPADIASMMRTLGAYIGLGDWRPKFGRFTVEAI